MASPSSMLHHYRCQSCGRHQSVVDPKPGPQGPGPGRCPWCGASPVNAFPVLAVPVSPGMEVGYVR